MGKKMVVCEHCDQFGLIEKAEVKAMTALAGGWLCGGCHAEFLGLTREGEIPEANYVACLTPK